MASIKEQYENLFLFLRTNNIFGTRLELEADDVMNVYYLNGYTNSNKFFIDIKEDGISLSFAKGDKDLEEKLVSQINEYNQDTVDISYDILDLNDIDRVVKVYEWTKNKDRIDAIKKSETMEFPYFTANVKVYKQEEETKGKKK